MNKRSINIYAKTLSRTKNLVAEKNNVDQAVKPIMGYVCDCDAEKGDILFLDEARNVLTNDYTKLVKSQSEEYIIKVGQ